MSKLRQCMRSLINQMHRSGECGFGKVAIRSDLSQTKVLNKYMRII